MKIQLTNRKYPTIVTLREVCSAVIKHVPSYEMDYENCSRRSRRVVKFVDAPQPEWMTIREACRRIVKVGEAIHGNIEVEGVEI